MDTKSLKTACIWAISLVNVKPNRGYCPGKSREGEIKTEIERQGAQSKTEKE